MQTMPMPLSNHQLQSKAPSIFATKPYHQVSSKYAFIPTSQALDTLKDHGWHPVQAFENRVRIDDKQGYQKHLVRLRNMDGFLSPEDEIDSMLHSRRIGDMGDDLWRVFNRIEESSIRGGIKGFNKQSGRNFTSKPLTSIDSTISINQRLFTLADKIANHSNSSNPHDRRLKSNHRQTSQTSQTLPILSKCRFKTMAQIHRYGGMIEFIFKWLGQYLGSL